MDHFLSPQSWACAVRRVFRPALAVAAAIAMSQSTANGFTQSGLVTTSARASLFSQASNLSGSFDGTGLPSTAIQLSPGANRYVTFPSVTGIVSPYSPADYHGADGGTFNGTIVNIFGLGGISAIIDSADRTLALMGVFSATSPPEGDQKPQRLDFRNKHSFESLSPLLNQGFFIGDGLTGTGNGTLQKFFVPNGANYLQLGFADAFNEQTPFLGLPSAYHDNLGTLTVRYTLVPEPSGMAVALAVIGLILFFGAAKHLTTRVGKIL